MHRLLTATALTLLALPAAAQDAPICGGISLVGEWLGGTPEGSDIATAAAPFDAEGSVPIAGHLVRMFSLSQPADIRVETRALPAGDPYLAVYDASGQEVAADDDSGGDFAARAEASLQPGSYCVAARSYESGVTDVAIRVGLQSHAALTDAAAPVAPTTPAAPAETPEAPSGAGASCGSPDVARLGDGLTAATLAGGVTVVGSATDAPGRAFSLAEPTPISITATSTGGDPLIRLRDGSGTQLAENDDAEGLDSRIDMTQPLPAGAYCIEVEDLNGLTEDIVVTLTAFDPAADRLARLGRAELAPGPDDSVEVIDLGTVQTSLIHDMTASGTASWLRLTLPEGGLLVTEAIGTDVDPIITLFDRVGRQVGENDDGPNGLDSFLAMRILPGDYLLAVRLVDQSARGPVRVLLERYVPAE
ncbi:PPC domain-containing protein [Jannaschia formosa]|uniref:PPC domain-containing protein n=1 Tax=Jannaschia formosa TaxID=2259592 RepID=UPI000E1BF840|nr:PPC domain-containing protein [Jannaschia formosa]TFL19583.1 ABC transporter substrate-binding protein [Jannaschia formosa]